MSSGAMEFESVVWHFGSLQTSLVFSWVVWAGLIGISIMVTRKAKLIPTGIQVIFEMLIEFICNMADEIIGPKGKNYYPLFIGLFFFILVGNLVGFIPGLMSPTSDPNLTFGLAIMVFFYFIFLGFKHNGLKYLNQFKPPKLPWYMLPVGLLLSVTEVISFFTRPFSLGLRLFCNIFSKELLLGILAWLMIDFFFKPTAIDKAFSGVMLGMRPAIMLLGLIVAYIQALVFMVLSMSYIAGAVHMEEH
ncbi:MAG: F0F1 ATP synthase subunit A [Chitinispirillaceae bacterium]|nr:F0F1 ATP synthase subunit A [Chitinispirillaceae bacterium]